jgi:hypothetical protein
MYTDERTMTPIFYSSMLFCCLCISLFLSVKYSISRKLGALAKSLLCDKRMIYLTISSTNENLTVSAAPLTSAGISLGRRTHQNVVAHDSFCKVTSCYQTIIWYLKIQQRRHTTSYTPIFKQSHRSEELENEHYYRYLSKRLESIICNSFA